MRSIQGALPASSLHTELSRWGYYRYTQLSPVSLLCTLYDIAATFCLFRCEAFEIVNAHVPIATTGTIIE